MTDCLRFPNSEYLGANPLGGYQCPRGFIRCPEPEHDIDDIRTYIHDREMQQQITPLSNILIAFLGACVSNTDNGDFADKLSSLGVRSILGFKVFFGGMRPRIGEGYRVWTEVFIPEIWRHLSHGATLLSAAQRAFERIKNEPAAQFGLAIIFPPRENCGSTRALRLFLRETADGERFFELPNGDRVHLNTIVKITGDTNIRIIDPNDPRARQRRGDCRCVGQ